MSTPTIYHLSIERFRSIESLSWYPGKSVNVLVGGGDVGKTSILDAIGLLLSPVNSPTLSDAEYLDRNVGAGFLIEAIMTLPPDSGVDEQGKLSWPWEWNGKEAVVPSAEASSASVSEAVYRVRVRGTEDLELAYEIVQPDDSADVFSTTMRRAIGLVRLSGDDRNDRDLRLVQGSALDRQLSDRGLRARLANDLAKQSVKNQLTEDAKKNLTTLDEAFGREGLPKNLDLAVTGSQGLSVAALIGLTAERRQGVQLPLASWGAGTRRIASLTIAAQKQGEAPITLVDELERGLEPYRQRSLMNKLQSGPSQVFVTTHSPFVISAASKACLWYVDHAGKVGALDSKKTAAHRKVDPETFLAYLSIISEGSTEKGFVTVLLEKAVGESPEKRGVYISDGGGHEKTLDLLEALAEGRMRFGGFADDEGGQHPDRWKKVEDRLQKLLFRWSKGCLEENFIGVVPDDKLDALVSDPTTESTGMRLRTLADRLNSPEKDWRTIKARAGANLKVLILGAALGTVPADKASDKKVYEKHAQCWFKTVSGGRELADKMFSLGVWPALKPQLLPFCNAVRNAVGLAAVEDLNP